jgi:hypothetical protein
MNLPGGAIHKDLRDLVYEAIKEFGWTAKQGPKGRWTIHSRQGDQKFAIPTSSGDSGYLLRQLKSRITKAVQAEAERARASMEADGASSTIANISLNDVGAVCEDCGDEFVTWEAFAVHQNREHRAPPSPDPLQVDKPVVQIEDQASPENTGSTTMGDMEEVVQGEILRPWRALKQRFDNGQVLTYESGAVFEVVVDGEVSAYQCRHCPWRADGPRSVVSHYAVVHIAKKEVPPTNRDTGLLVEDGSKFLQKVTHRKWIVPADEMTKAIYDALLANPKQSRETTSIHAKRVTDALIGEGWVLVKQGDRVPTEEGDLIEATEAQMILDEIRALVGADSGEVAELQAQVATAQAAAVEERMKAEEAQAALAEVTTEKDKVRTFLDTLASLAKEANE